MFTGIVEELGQIKTLAIGGSSGSIVIKAKTVLEETKIGDSIAVNGICLTVTELYSDGFRADVMAETVRRSSLKNAKNGDYVNLERAMAANGRFGGHIVSGHIDGTGIIKRYEKEENATWVTISCDASILNLIVEKGSICIDGISLTVAVVESDCFKVSIIPHTGTATTLLHRGVGDSVNLENDIVGKYVQRLLGLSTSSAQAPESTLTMDMLRSLDF